MRDYFPLFQFDNIEEKKTQHVWVRQNNVLGIKLMDQPDKTPHLKLPIEPEQFISLHFSPEFPTLSS
jgi:hypothetical protein